MNPSAPESSNRGPFLLDRHYRVRKDFMALRDKFTEGELLVYDSQAYSRYDGITGYFFRQEGTAGLRLWDIYDHEDEAVWKELFELLPASSSSAESTLT